MREIMREREKRSAHGAPPRAVALSQSSSGDGQKPRCCRVRSLVRLMAGLTLSSVLVLLLGAAALSRRQQRQRGAAAWNRGAVQLAVPKETSEQDEIEAGGRRVLTWLREQGGYVGPVKLSNVRRGDLSIRGLVATQNIAANTTLVRVPRQLLFVGDDVDQRKYTPSGSASLNKHADSDVFLAVRVAEERSKGSASKFWPYLAEMPSMEEYASFHPLAAAAADLEPFAELPTVKRVRETKEKIKKKFHAMGIDKMLEWEEFWHGYVTYISRAYGITIKGRDGGALWQPAIAPGADFGNTVAPERLVNTQWRYDRPTEAFEVTSTQEVKAGDELFESYQISSLKDNAHLAFMFGFTLADNAKPVLQMPSQICRKLLRSGRASLEAPGKEGLGKSATRVRQMLYRLVQEHCRASGEEQDLAREGGDGWQGVPDRLRGRLRGSRQEPELATAGGGVGSAGEVASSAAASPARLTIDGAEEGRGRGQITGIRGVGAGLDEGGESRGSEGMGQGSRGAEDGARQGVGGGSTRDDWLSLQHMGLQTRYRVISTGIGHGGHLGPSPARVVSKGDTVTVHATGRLDATGATFWSTRDAGHAPFTFRAGVGAVIRGWDAGCLGMMLGERRQLAIPAAEGYGTRGFESWGIPPDSALLFDVEVLTIAARGSVSNAQ